MTLEEGLVYIVVLVMSAVVHEVMHGVAADWLGDKTARYAGRLTLNPIPHIDVFGSILLPALFIFTHSPIFFAYAKPVPYNPYNLRPGRFSEAIVAFAGPLSNLGLAVVFGLLARAGVFALANDIFVVVVMVNVMLFFFNLIPIPPLDGSKVFAALLPGSLRDGYERFRVRLESNPLSGMLIAVVLVSLFGTMFYNMVLALAGIIIGAA